MKTWQIDKGGVTKGIFESKADAMQYGETIGNCTMFLQPKGKPSQSRFPIATLFNVVTV